MEFPIREDQNHNLFVCGLSEKAVGSAEEFNTSFLPASLNRSAVDYSDTLFKNKTVSCHDNQ